MCLSNFVLKFDYAGYPKAVIDFVELYSEGPGTGFSKISNVLDDASAKADVVGAQARACVLENNYLHQGRQPNPNLPA